MGHDELVFHGHGLWGCGLQGGVGMRQGVGVNAAPLQGHIFIGPLGGLIRVRIAQAEIDLHELDACRVIYGDRESDFVGYGIQAIEDVRGEAQVREDIAGSPGDRGRGRWRERRCEGRGECWREGRREGWREGESQRGGGCDRYDRFTDDHHVGMRLAPNALLILAAGHDDVAPGLRGAPGCTDRRQRLAERRGSQRDGLAVDGQFHRLWAARRENVEDDLGLCQGQAAAVQRGVDPGLRAGPLRQVAAGQEDRKNDQERQAAGHGCTWFNWSISACTSSGENVRVTGWEQGIFFRAALS